MFSLSHFDMNSERALNECIERSWGKENFNAGLERVQSFLSSHPISSEIKIITVAGTNGKGETSRAITYILEQQKKKVALWTSPHLISVTERFYFDKKLISYTKLMALIESVSSFQEKTGVKLSYYELLFCCFLLWAKEISPDYLVLEVGLGGRLDAVNVLSCHYAIISSISRDHQEFLGKTYKKILIEKFGICRHRALLFTAFELDYLNAETKKLVSEMGNQWVRFKADFSMGFSQHNRKLALSICEKILDSKIEMNELFDKKLHPILGEYQEGEIDYTFYGSHNPEALRKLVHFSSSSPYNKKSAYDLILFSLSKRNLEDGHAVIDLITRVPARRRIFVPMHHHKAQELSEIELFLKSSGIEIYKELPKEFIQRLEKKTRVLVTGSNYFIGEFFHKFCQGGK